MIAGLPRVGSQMFISVCFIIAFALVAAVSGMRFGAVYAMLFALIGGMTGAAFGAINEWATNWLSQQFEGRSPSSRSCCLGFAYVAVLLASLYCLLWFFGDSLPSLLELRRP